MSQWDGVFVTKVCFTCLCTSFFVVYVQAAWATGQEGRERVWKGAGKSKEGELVLLKYAYHLSSLLEPHVLLYTFNMSLKFPCVNVSVYCDAGEAAADYCWLFGTLLYTFVSGF